MSHRLFWLALKVSHFDSNERFTVTSTRGSDKGKGCLGESEQDLLKLIQKLFSHDFGAGREFSEDHRACQSLLFSDRICFKFNALLSDSYILKSRPGGVAWWLSVCFALSVPWVWSPAFLTQKWSCTKQLLLVFYLFIYAANFCWIFLHWLSFIIYLVYNIASTRKLYLHSLYIPIIW